MLPSCSRVVSLGTGEAILGGHPGCFVVASCEPRGWGVSLTTWSLGSLCRAGQGLHWRGSVGQLETETSLAFPESTMGSLTLLELSAQLWRELEKEAPSELSEVGPQHTHTPWEGEAPHAYYRVGSRAKAKEQEAGFPLRGWGGGHLDLGGGPVLATSYVKAGRSTPCLASQHMRGGQDLFPPPYRTYVEGPQSALEGR